LIGGDVTLYRGSANVLQTDDSFVTGGSITSGSNIIAESGYISTGLGGGGFLGEIRLLGDTSGTVTILPQTSAGTYNFNLPTTAGSSGDVLTSGGGGGSAMTWTAPGALAVRWNSLVNPNGNQSLTMSTHTTTWNWATGTSTNNLFNLTTDASANGTGALLRVATGTSSTVVPLLVVAAGTTALTVNASAQVLVNSLTATRVTFAGTSGLLTDAANFTYTTGTGQLALATTGSGAGILIGGDTQLYRDAADVIRTPDSVRIDTAVGINVAWLALQPTCLPISTILAATRHILLTLQTQQLEECGVSTSPSPLLEVALLVIHLAPPESRVCPLIPVAGLRRVLRVLLHMLETLVVEHWFVQRDSVLFPQPILAVGLSPIYEA
jgi:energy-converting hydrogenase Eha subunit A